VIRSRASVLDAALDELAERGYGAFTIDGVATRSGVARSTIYRLWRDRPSLVAAAMEELNQQPRPLGPDDEPPRERVRTLLRHLAEAMRSSRVAACLPALVDGAERDPAVRALHHGYNDRRRAALVEALRAVVEAGDAHPGVDPETAAFALAGAVVYRRLMTASPLGAAEVDTLLETVLGVPAGG